jgi:PAS domain S-box-containing protein
MLAGVMLSVKRLIKKPLQEFSERIDSIAKGDYTIDTQTIYVELQGVMERFNQMAVKVKHREESLVEANKRLTSEIEERKKMERLLRESEERYRSLNANVPIGVFRNAINGKFISLNPALMQMLEIREGDDLGDLQAIDVYCHSADRDYLVNEITRYGWINGFECRFKTYGGNQIWVSISARGIKDESGRITYIDGIVQNITQQKEVEEEKDRLQSQLIQVQKMEAIGTLAGGIAHDFNNILGAILGYAQLAQINSTEDPKIRKYLDQIFTASERAKELVKQILTFSRQAETEKIPVDVGVIVKEALKLLRASIPTTIEIRRKVESNLGVVEADSIQIHQIVMNLCTNAFHAMEQEGGRLDVSLIPVEIEAADALLYQDITPGRYLKLTVADTGHGMDANTMSRIFEPYYTTKDVGMGTGMGLATVHGIVKKHGGDITVCSEQGVGTTFQVLLPVTEIEMKRDRDNSTSLPIGNEKILLVDDEKTLADLGKDLLESLGYSVETRTSAHDALEAFRIQPGKYHLIITDMTMPNMHGKKLAKEIKKIRPDIPIILCTGYSTLLSSDHAMDQSISRILMKPLTVAELGTSVRNVLDEAKDSIQK